MTESKIIPPPELVQQWVDLLPQGSVKAFTAAAQWGYQQAVKELENYLEQQHLDDIANELEKTND